jgi:hypothetical protein
MVCEAVSVTIWDLTQIELSVEETVLRGSSWWLLPFLFPVYFLWSILVTQEPGNCTVICPMVYNAYIWQIATWCPKGIVKLLSPPQCMQPLAWCLTPWLPWTRSLFAVLGHYPSLPRTTRVGFWRGWIICNIYIKLVWPPEDVWNVSETCRVDV